LSTPALLNAVFELPDGETFPATPVKLGREWVVFRLVNRHRPDEAAFTDEVRESTREVLETLKRKETVDLYIQQLRAKAVAEKALRVNPLPSRDGNS
jgi:parvulin-like peptidyl-prolyl isomerase